MSTSTCGTISINHFGSFNSATNSGFGGGYGESSKTKDDEVSIHQKRPLGEGAGGGGGMYARAKGVFEITETGTRFIPADTTRQILTGIAIGFLLKSFFFKKGKR